MNAIMHQLPLRMTRKRKIWLSNGALVSEPKPVIVPAKSKVTWQAHVVDRNGLRGVAEYPVINGSGVYSIDHSHVNGHPADQIRKDYLHQVEGKVAPELYQQLKDRVGSEQWAIATIVHTIHPV